MASKVCNRCQKSVAGSRCLTCGGTEFTSKEADERQRGREEAPHPQPQAPPRAQPVTQPQSQPQAQPRPAPQRRPQIVEGPKEFASAGSTTEQIQQTEAHLLQFDDAMNSTRVSLDQALGVLSHDIAIVMKQSEDRARQVIDGMTKQEQEALAALDQKLQMTISAYEKRAAVRRTYSANRTKEAGLRLRDDVKQLNYRRAQYSFASFSVGDALQATEVRDLATVGTLKFPQASQLDRDLPAVAALVPFVDRGHIIVESTAGTPDAPNPQLKALLNSLVAQAFSSAPPGQMVVTVFNPKSSKILAGFLPTGAPTAGLLKVLQPTKDALKKSLLEHLDFMVRAEASIGNHASMSDLIRTTGQHEHQYHCLVILDAPMDWTPEAQDVLEKLMSAGAKAGLSVIIHRDPETNVERVNPAALYRHASVLRANGSDWELSVGSHTAMPVAPLPLITQGEQTALMSAIVAGAETGSLPNINFAELVEQVPATSDAGIRIAMGRKGAQATEFVLGDTVTNIQNVLVGGRAGSGKTNLLKVMIYSMAARYTPEELELFLLDFKEGGDFMPFIGGADFGPLPNASVVSRDCDATFGIATLRHFESEMTRRSKITSDNHVSNVWDLRARTGIVLPRWVLVIDEFQGLFSGSTNREATSILENLVRKGRSFGLHVILATQTLSGVSFAGGDKDRAIFENIAGRIALQLGPGEFGRFMRSDNDEGDQLRYRGQAIFNPASGAKSENQLFVVAHADSDYTNKLQDELHRQSVQATGKMRAPFVYRGGEFVSAEQLLAHSGRPRGVEGETPVWIGRDNTITADVSTTVLSPVAGSHVLLLGGDATTTKNAIATLQTAVMSAVAASTIPVQVLLLESLIPTFRNGALLDEWIAALATLGASVVRYDDEHVSEFVATVSDAAERRQPTIAVMLGAENTDFKRLATEKANWKELVRELPRRNVNIVGYWPDLRDIPGDQYSLKSDYKTMLFFGTNDQIIVDASGRARDTLPRLHPSKTVVFTASGAQDGATAVTAIQPLTQADIAAFAALGSAHAGTVVTAGAHPAPEPTVAEGPTPEPARASTGSVADTAHAVPLSDAIRAQTPGLRYALGHDAGGAVGVGAEHLVVAGRIGSGVDETLQIALHSLASAAPASSQEIALLDLMEGGDFPELVVGALPQLGTVIVSEDAAIANDLLQRYRSEAQRRRELFVAAGVTGFDAYAEVLPQMALVINSAGDLDAEGLALLDALASESVNTGIHLVVGFYEPFEFDGLFAALPQLASSSTIAVGRVPADVSRSLLGHDGAAQLIRGRQLLLRRPNGEQGSVALATSDDESRAELRRLIRGGGTA